MNEDDLFIPTVFSMTAAQTDCRPLTAHFFDADPQTVAKSLLGKVLCHWVKGQWLMASIVETEAYYRTDKASHASLGYTHTRRALFAPAGTIYMYYSRGAPSFNISCQGAGNAVLCKAGQLFGMRTEDTLQHRARRKIERALQIAATDGCSRDWNRCVPSETMKDWLDRALSPSQRWILPADSKLKLMFSAMSKNTMLPGDKHRPSHRICAGQTLLCKALGLYVEKWNNVLLPSPKHYLKNNLWTLPAPNPQYRLQCWDIADAPTLIWQTPRLGIPMHRDPHLPYRYIDARKLTYATRSITDKEIETKSAKLIFIGQSC